MAPNTMFFELKYFKEERENSLESARCGGDWASFPTRARMQCLDSKWLQRVLSCGAASTEGGSSPLCPGWSETKTTEREKRQIATKEKVSTGPLATRYHPGGIPLC